MRRLRQPERAAGLSEVRAAGVVVLTYAASAVLGAFYLVVIPTGVAFVLVEGVYRWRHR